MQKQLTLEFLTELLQEYRIISEAQKKFFLSRIEYYATRYKEKNKKDPFVTELVLSMCREENIPVEEEFLVKLVAGRAGCDYITINPLKIDSQLVMQTISLPYGLKHHVLPLSADNNEIQLAMADPFKMELLDQLSSTLGKTFIPVVASATDIEKTLRDIFGFKKSIKAAVKDAKKEETYNNIEQLTALTTGDIDDKHIVRAVDYMLKYAIEQGASDIHIEPKRDESHVRFRIDGVMHTIYHFPMSVHLPFLSRLKMLSRMDIAEKRRPQDGRIKVQMPDGEEVELRASTIPVISGEKIVLRILESGHFIKNVDKVGFTETQLEGWRKATKKGYGMLLVTGPTGSGKTTTLYSTLKEIARPEINIVSVEDPVEIVLPEINQMGVNAKAGITFSSALRHILRQDPDIIMVGEIRDRETADNAVQAALTGHLVFSTLHTNDTASTVERMIDLGVEPFLLGSVLNGIVAQRLVRKLCPFCSFERKMTEEEKISLFLPVEKEYVIHDSEGCVKCRYTGYKGRTAIMEYMPVTPKMSKLIAERATAEEIRNNALMDGMISLREAAIKKLADGITSFDETVKALYFE